MNIRHKKIVAGETFKTNEGGCVTVIKYRDSRSVLIEHKDKFSHRATVDSSQLRSGSVKNPYFPKIYGVGYVGVGEHKTAANGRDTPAYKSWCSMLRRAYSPEYHAGNPAYADVAVCDEWLNFQVYAEWWHRQPHHGNEFELDKDLRIAGNREYSPQACSFVPKAINRLIGKKKPCCAELPCGVRPGKRGYEARLGVNGKSVSLGFYSTVSQAFRAYKDAKERSIREAAERWRNSLHPEVYEYLKAWAAD